MKQLLFICALIAIVALVAIPATLSCRRSAAHAKVISNAQQISISLIEFDNHYGHFPGTQIPEDLLNSYPQQFRDDSNYVLGQLFAAKVIESEQVFTINSSSKSDDIIEPTSEILKAGECQFSYISQAGDIPMSSSSPFPSEIPVLLAPMIAGTDQFDPYFLGKRTHRYVYSKQDGSVWIGNIGPHRQARLKGQGKAGILQTGPDTIWEEHHPVIHHPLPYKGAPSSNTPFWATAFYKRVLDPQAILLILISLFIAYYLFLHFRKQAPIQN